MKTGLRFLAVVFLLVSSASAGDIEVHFINVGQGDCTLIKCPNGRRILIDCGTLGGGNKESIKGYLHEQLDTDNPTVDVLVVTHPDQDHYNLLPHVLEGVEVKSVLIAGDSSEYTVAEMEGWLDNHGNVTNLEEDDFDPADDPSDLFGDGETDFHVLAANTNKGPSRKNARSIVLMVTHDKFDVLLTGDATHATEKRIVDRYDDEWLDVEVLKIGHHGSNATFNVGRMGRDCETRSFGS